MPYRSEFDSRLRYTMTEIWTPNGLFVTDDHPDIVRLNTAARNYHPDLSVAVNKETGGICLFLSNPDYHKGMQPVFGWDHIPHETELIARLYRTDTRKHGDKILTDAWKEADRRKEEERKPVYEAAEEAAELIEFELRER